MAIKNFLLGPIYFFIVLFVASLLKKRLVKNEVEDFYYYKALLAKLFGVSFFALIYHYYYNAGDTVAFYHWSSEFFSFLFSDFSDAMSFLFTGSEDAFYVFKYGSHMKYGYILKYQSRETALIKMTAIVNFFGLNSYMSTSYLFAFFSFICNWLLYRVFSDNCPDIKKQLIWATLFVPSVVFWGGGIMKDTVSFSGICLLVYTIHKVFVKRQNIVRNIFLLGFAAIMILQMKAYILLAFLPAGAIWIFGELKDKIKLKAVRIFLTPVFYLGGVAFLFLLVSVLGEELDRFSLSKIDQTVKDYQGWHKVASEGGSGYDLDVKDSSISSMLAAFPKAINVTLFRPYLWEVSNPVVLMASIESTLFLLFFTCILWKTKIVGLVKGVIAKPIVQMAFIYFILLGFAVGFTSYNFGALVRYKIPVMPFFTFFLVYGWSQVVKKKSI